ncbi:sensor histidine kinase [Luteimonas aestuarii]|uniref:sensor histidine kinase n=1 Tax=Luteimonas aestuarii TaxID=453837 RepID=UPI001FB59D68|nr:ATP-binding protein [Luteimonas aestuarii]
MAEPDVLDANTSRALQRELYLFALYRVFEAAVLALVVFSPVGALIGDLRAPLLAQVTTCVYLLLSIYLLARKRRPGANPTTLVLAAVAIDILVATLASHALPTARAGIALMLLFNLAASALFVSRNAGLGIAAAASLALLAEFTWNNFSSGGDQRPLAEVMMYSVAFFSVAALAHTLGKQMRASFALADKRGAEAANLAEINELIIRRMRTGVLLVDGQHEVRLANEAAMALLRDDDDISPQGVHGRPLSQLAPGLALRHAQWLRDGKADETTLVYGPEQIEVLPRFVRLLGHGNATLVFLDDTSMLSRRAESITLAAMGRFSASLAHEIRNPLAAINYATQLLEESSDLSTSDRRLLQIIHQQCMRTNGIVESVLGLARRERAQPEHIDLVPFVHNFIDDYKMVTAEDNAKLQLTGGLGTLPAVFDQRHLQQVFTALVNNAVRYGRMPGEIARITIHLEHGEHGPVISISDRGPGIPDAVVPQLFRPFFTTSDNGTGLGLYIANELCRGNEAELRYVSMPGGGACFRIELPGQQALLKQ